MAPKLVAYVNCDDVSVSLWMPFSNDESCNRALLKLHCRLGLERRRSGGIVGRPFVLQLRHDAERTPLLDEARQFCPGVGDAGFETLLVEPMQFLNVFVLVIAKDEHES